MKPQESCESALREELLLCRRVLPVCAAGGLVCSLFVFFICRASTVSLFLAVGASFTFGLCAEVSHRADHPDGALTVLLSVASILLNLSFGVREWDASTTITPADLLVHAILMAFLNVFVCLFSLRAFSSCVFVGVNTLCWTALTVWLSVHSSSSGKEAFAVFGAAGLSVSQAAVVKLLLTQRSSKRLAREVEVSESGEGQKQFLSYVFHEIRGPLGGAYLMMSEVTSTVMEVKKKMSVSGERERMPEGVESSIESLFELSEMVQAQMTLAGNVCNEVLQMEKVNSGCFEYEFRSEEVVSFFFRIMQEEQLVFKQKNVKLRLELDIRTGDTSAPSVFSNQPAFPVHLMESRSVFLLGYSGTMEGEALVGWADFLRIRQVVGNFLSNARKFTPSGGEVTMRVSASLLDDVPSHPPGSCPHADRLPDLASVCLWARIRVEVQDSGAGIDPADLSKLFKPYSQIKAGSMQGGGGTGLGLCISRVFVEAHCGGEVGVESEGEGRGSTFFFEFETPVLSTGSDGPERRPPNRVSETLTTEIPVGDSESRINSGGWGEVEGEQGDSEGKESGGEEDEIPVCDSLSSLASPPPATLSVWMSASRRTSEVFDGAPRLPIASRSSGKEEQEGLRQRRRRSSGRDEEATAFCFPQLDHGVLSDGSPLSPNSAATPRRQSQPVFSQRRASALEIAAKCRKKRSGTAHEIRGLPLLVHLPGLWGREGGPAGLSERDLRNFTADVLVVDDSAVCQIASALALRRLGYSVVTAGDGTEAVDRVVSRGQTFRAIFLDAHMPQMGGAEAVASILRHFSSQQARTRRERAKQLAAENGGNQEADLQLGTERERERERPVLIGLSGDAESMNAFLSAGCDRVLLKPIGASKFSAALEELNIPPQT